MWTHSKGQFQRSKLDVHDFKITVLNELNLVHKVMLSSTWCSTTVHDQYNSVGFTKNEWINTDDKIKLPKVFSYQLIKRDDRSKKGCTEVHPAAVCFCDTELETSYKCHSSPQIAPGVLHSTKYRVGNLEKQSDFYSTIKLILNHHHISHNRAKLMDRH